MPYFGRVKREAQGKQFHRYASQSFVFKNQRYWTTATLAQCLPTWTSSSVVENTYKLNYTLIEHLQVLGKEARITRENIQALSRSYQCLELRLQQEQARIKKQSRWFSLTQQAYLLAWQRELEAAYRRVDEVLIQLQTAACNLSREQPVPLEIMLFNTQTLGKPTMLSMPLQLMPYSPATGSLWRWWFNIRGYYTFLSTKQDLLTSLHLYLALPEADHRQITATEEKLRQELDATTQKMEQARFYQFIWCAFLEAWKEALKAALVRLAEGKVVWHERINARLNQQVDAIKEDTELRLPNLDPDAFEYWTDEDITNAQDKLKKLESGIRSQVQKLDKETGGIGIQNKQGKAFYNQITILLTKIKQRQQAFETLNLLAQNKVKLDQLHLINNDIPDVNINNFNSDPCIQKLNELHTIIETSETCLKKPNTGMDNHKASLKKWQEYVSNCLKELTSIKKNMLVRIYRRIDTYDCSSANSAIQIRTFISEFKASADKTLISENAELIIQWLDESLDKIISKLTSQTISPIQVETEIQNNRIGLDI